MNEVKLAECVLTKTNRAAATVIYSEKAKALQKVVWKEIIQELRDNVPELQADLSTL